MFLEGWVDASQGSAYGGEKQWLWLATSLSKRFLMPQLCFGLHCLGLSSMRLPDADQGGARPAPADLHGLQPAGG
jgi:hypothetical protein